MLWWNTCFRFKDTNKLNMKDVSCKQQEKWAVVDPQISDKIDFEKKFVT